MQADETIQSEIESTRNIKRRVEHLQEVEAQNEKRLPLWQKTRLDRMLVEYFLRAGYYNTAIRLAQHSNIEVQIILCSLTLLFDIVDFCDFVSF